MNVDTFPGIREAGKAIAVAGGCVFAADVLLPAEDEKTEVLGAKKAKEAVMFGSVAAIILARAEPKAIGYGFGAIAGTLLADGVHHAIGAPKLLTYDEGGAGEGAGPEPAEAPAHAPAAAAQPHSRPAAQHASRPPAARHLVPVEGPPTLPPPTAPPFFAAPPTAPAGAPWEYADAAAWMPLPE